MRGRYKNIKVVARRFRESIDNSLVFKYLEIGTYDGRHASEVLSWPFWKGCSLEYYGFDLFENLTERTLEREISKPRRPPSLASVEKYLRAATSARIKLFGGDTCLTLPRIAPGLPTMDLIFIDGGHSLKTIANDWKYCEKLMGPETTVLLDDYYITKNDCGCKRLVDSLPRGEFKVTLLQPIETYPRTGPMQMIQVERR